jgi:hypothetical protein
MKEHPITPPPELVQAFLRSNPSTPAEMTYEQFIATRFARWGADQELEACCSWADATGWYGAGDMLRAARRPKPPSLKEQALEIVRGTPVNSAGLYSYEHVKIIRRALEQLDD